MMFVYLTLLMWLAIIVYWFVAAAVDSQTSIRSELIPLFKIFAAGFLIYLPLITEKWFAIRLYAPNSWINLAGVFVCTLGAAVAAWARICLGHNWSGRVILQKQHQLVEAGPYGLIRHPIYTGVLLMMLGAALVLGYIFSFVYLALSIFGLIRKSKQEEDLLASEFPEDYPRYKQETKRLLPFIF
jgi:protein-S-isoprenylcysteine O-methyltransferase Ste14